MPATASGDRDKPRLAFDLGALMREAGPEPDDIQFTYAGRRWKLKHLDAMDGWDAVDLFGGEVTGSQGIRLLEAAFGTKQWAEFREHTRGKLSKRGIDLLGQEYVRACGIDPGESPASSG